MYSYRCFIADFLSGQVGLSHMDNLFRLIGSDPLRGHGAHLLRRQTAQTILDADKLTVAERDKFLEDVVSEVQKRVDNADRGQKLDEAFLKKTIDEAGKAAGNAYIEYTCCTIDYMEQYEWD